MTKEAILGAVARGWCHPKNEHKIMDADLAEAIAEEVWQVDNEPNLGFATTAQLLDELKARAEVGGYAEYRTMEVV